MQMTSNAIMDDWNLVFFTSSVVARPTTCEEHKMMHEGYQHFFLNISIKAKWACKVNICGFPSLCFFIDGLRIWLEWIDLAARWFACCLAKKQKRIWKELTETCTNLLNNCDYFFIVRLYVEKNYKLFSWQIDWGSKSTKGHEITNKRTFAPLCIRHHEYDSRWWLPSVARPQWKCDIFPATWRYQQVSCSRTHYRSAGCIARTSAAHECHRETSGDAIERCDCHSSRAT